MDLSDYVIEHAEKTAISKFITKEVEVSKNDCLSEDILKLCADDCFFKYYKVDNMNKYLDDNFLYEWFYHPDETIDKKIKEVLADENSLKRVVGNLYRAKLNYNKIHELDQNHNHQYDSYYKRRDMFSALKENKGVKITLKINYNNETIDFKFSRDSLMRTLKAGIDSLSEYDKSYEPVNNFIKKQLGIDHRYGTESFDIDKIQEIRYGRNILYEDKQMIEKSRNLSKSKGIERTR